MSNIIIGIHGLSNKPSAQELADGWKDAIIEGLNKNEKVENLSVNFSLVYWADVLYPEPDENPDLYKRAEEGTIKTYEESWKDAVRTKVFSWGGNIIDSMKKNFGMDAAADEVLEHKLKDLSRYYEEKEIQNELRKRLKDEILLHKEKRIMLLSHSMGTIIAYDVLREIGIDNPSIEIDHFVTFGSPLGLPHVKYKVAQERSPVRTPSIVKKWSNYSDKRDPVALDVHLADDYFQNDNHVKVKDDLVSNDWGGIHHKSYGYLRTPEISHAINEFIQN